ncbi:hypothetical protein CARUB_v10018537mg [Capsella rubella]|uniref:Pectinesterase inhibitor domain-containing protein n=1 Tax=Capsella rubella TaxID=81985 RepID=R0H7E7_9BRAS|nr:pectinesterase inhibitor 5 [Capsella rubella]EOA25224.1 hypothetical protein CARUB_v10018537mg [Capsella rubella]
MATMLRIHMTFPLSSLLVFVFFAFTAANAMLIKDMYAFCKETDDVNFCLKYIGTDVRILAARDLRDVLVIAISKCKIQVSNAARHINKVSYKYSSQLGTQRVYFCRKYYKLASDSFQKAYEEAQEKAYANSPEVSAREGSMYVCMCENEWKKDGPDQKSPVTFYNTNVVKLISIIDLIIGKLYG